MTEQKKKAKELIDKFKGNIAYHKKYTNLSDRELLLMSVECAKSCTDEILKEIYSNNVITNDKRRIFWQEVRKEIINYKN
jgi:hypothetical protein